ncbi:MAG: DUF4124 domain-containing protein [Gammaproteobacteria bacterium]|nr:DUF4124 domain-containing protein [Gammaproteobacteria bacterium]
MPTPSHWLLGGLLFLFTLSASAENAVYRWADDQGVTQYTQHPPLGRPAEKISQRHYRAATKAQDTLRQQTDGLAERRELKNLTQTFSAKEKKEQQQRQAFCEKSRQNINMLQTRQHISEKAPDGSIIALGAEQKAAKIQKIRAQIAEHCP